MAREIGVLRATELGSGGCALSLAGLVQEQVSPPSPRKATFWSKNDH